VEPTGAACWAALSAGLVDEPPAAADAGVPFAVAPLCGSGLKSKPPTTSN
jgi:threonine synthase